MNWHTTRNGRFQSILAFSFLSTYILSFLFEGQVLYGLLEGFSLEQATNQFRSASDSVFGVDISGKGF